MAKGPRSSNIRYLSKRRNTYRRKGRPTVDDSTILNNRLFSRTQIGEPVGAANCKLFYSNSNATIATRTLYSVNLTLCARGSEEYQREGNIINCRGFKVDYSLMSLANSAILVNVAVVCQKDLTAAPPAVSGFFRNPGTGAAPGERGIDFDIALPSLQFHLLGINPDKFTVLAHKRFQLSAGSSGMDNFHRTGSFFVRLNRQLSYSGNASSNCNEQIAICYWVDRIDAAAGSASAASQLRANISGTTYFRERGD